MGELLHRANDVGDVVQPLQGLLHGDGQLLPNKLKIGFLGGFIDLAERLGRIAPLFHLALQLFVKVSSILKYYSDYP